MASIDLEVFGLKSVQLLIDGHLAYWEFYNFYFIGLPLFIQVIIYNIWATVVLPNLGRDSVFDDIDTVCKIVIILISVYQLLLESTAVFTARLSYIKSVTRLIKIVAPILLIVVAVRNTDTAADLSVSYLTLQCWTALAIWMRFFLFLRTRDKYDWYIRLIIESFYDMRHFLVIMMLGVLAFASAFLQVDIIMIKEETIEAPEIPEDANWYDKYIGFYNLAFKDSILTALG